MTRLHALALCALALTVPTGAAAQILGTDTAGYPIRGFFVSLTSGHSYTVATDTTLTPLPGFGGADSVITVVPGIWSGADVNFSGSTGADGCGTSVYNSCVTFPATTSTYTVMLYAWSQYSPGQTNLWITDNTAHTGPTSITGGLVTFGGARASTNFALGSGRAFVSTVHRPGANAGSHAIVTTDSLFDALHGVWNNGRAPGTAKIDGDVGTKNQVGYLQQIYGTTDTTNVGPIRLLQNDWFVTGADNDGDGLGDGLERALKTCDRVTDPNPSTGFACASLAGCSTPSSALCFESLRDTDHDGLRDDLEVFGYGDPLLRIPLWGANPAHMDRFIEVDAYDEMFNPIDPTDPAFAGCQTFAPTSGFLTGLNPTQLGLWGGNQSLSSSVHASTLQEVQNAYGLAPASLNPDGLAGISLHFDVGVTDPVLGASNTLWGNWGGGGTCIPAACGYDYAYNNDTSAGCPPGPYIAAARKWVFQYGVDATVSGQTKFDNALVAAHTETWMHELGHAMSLGHSGPPGSTAAYSNGFGNGRFQYPTRMNYAYEFAGGSYMDFAPSASMLFSSGAWATVPLSSSGANEICPLTPAANLSLVQTINGSGFPIGLENVQPSGGCWNVDWNYDSSYGGTHAMARLWGATHSYGAGHDERYSELHSEGLLVPPQTRLQYSRPDATLVGDVLLMAEVTQPPGYPAPGIFVRAESTKDCNDIPLDMNTQPVTDATYGTAQSYPGCYRPGTETQILSSNVVSVGIERATLSDGHLGAVVVYLDAAGCPHWGELETSPSAGAAEFTYSMTWRGAVTGLDCGSALFEPSVPELAQTSDGGVILEVRSGASPKQATLAPGGLTWSVSPALKSDGSPMPTYGFTVATQATNVWAAAQTPTGIDFYVLDTTGSPMSSRRWFYQTTWAAIGKATPTLAFVPDESGGTRMNVYMLGTNFDPSHPAMRQWVLGSASNLFTTWLSAMLVGTEAAGANGVAVWDNRTGLVPGPALRIWRGLVYECGATGLVCPSGSTCDSYRDVCVKTPGSWPVSSSLREDPFGEGWFPGYFTDYNDWVGAGWGVCHARETVAAPSTTDDYVRVSYNDPARCGPLPVYPEPATHTTLVTPPPRPSNDRALHPGLYSYDWANGAGDPAVAGRF